MQAGFFFLIALVIFLILSFRWYFSRKTVVKRALKKTGIKRIADFADNDTGRVVGKVVFAGQTLTAPLSGRKCSYYHVIVEELRSNGKSSSWHTIIEEEEAGDVVISDGTHYAVIDTDNTKSYLVPDANYTSGTFNDATPELEHFLARHGRNSTNFFGFNKRLRFKEGVLELNETFAVAGHGRWEEAQKHELHLPVKKVLLICKTEEEPVYLSDDPETTQPGGLN